MSSFMYSYRNARMWNKTVFWSFRYALTVVSRNRRQLETASFVRNTEDSATS
jgi:hypothetical protein